MSGNPLLYTAIQVRAFERKMEKQIELGSVYEQFSSRVSETTSAQNGDKSSMPGAVVNSKTDAFQKGVMYTTIPTMDKLKKRGPSGAGKAQGTEEVVKIRYARCYYNTQRKVVTFGDESVDGDAIAAYPIASEGNRLTGDYFANLNDYDKHAAVILGANEDLFNADSWAGTSVFGGNAPVGAALHPRTYCLGQATTAPVTWNATFATHVGSAVTAFNAANASSLQLFTKAKLDKIIGLANRTVIPLTAAKTGAIQYIILMSQVQADQLRADTADGGWWKTMTEAGARGTENKSISGLLGIYLNCMLLVDIRAPLFNMSGSGAYTGTALNRIQFVKPWADDPSKAEDIDAGENRIPTTYVYNATPASVVGTAEICQVLGLGAILETNPKKLTYHSDTQDYDFSKGIEARKSCGNMRPDYTGENVLPGSWSSLTVAPANFTSFIVLSPTTGGSL